MGYTTDFSGTFEVSPALNADEIEFLKELADTRRMIRHKGPLHVGDTGHLGRLNSDDDTSDVINHNRAEGEGTGRYGTGPQVNSVSGGQPGLWLQWVPTDNGDEIVWSEGEKFYHSFEWIEYLISRLLGPDAKAYLEQYKQDYPDYDRRLDSFTCDHRLDGIVYCDGEDSDDNWRIRISNNVAHNEDGTLFYGEAAQAALKAEKAEMDAAAKARHEGELAVTLADLTGATKPLVGLAVAEVKEDGDVTFLTLSDGTLLTVGVVTRPETQ